MEARRECETKFYGFNILAVFIFVFVVFSVIALFLLFIAFLFFFDTASAEVESRDHVWTF